ncbi:hypothetical protein DFP72DRAFT_1085520 [Ephemerocybe angulata]|uniref:Uncharacterized protein n=1 Tax=Ephemerocybe angulata TaxID=980116 RepID=A0A8H6LSE4_9AGAR|nr:hypothetical protein DFP72DRAFT_1085520 [Tulosesus angulatus]
MTKRFLCVWQEMSRTLMRSLILTSADESLQRLEAAMEGCLKQLLSQDNERRADDADLGNAPLPEKRRKTQQPKRRKGPTSSKFDFLTSLSPTSLASTNVYISQQVSLAAAQPIMPGPSIDPTEITQAVSGLFQKNRVHRVWALTAKFEKDMPAQNLRTLIRRGHILQLYGAAWTWLNASVSSAYSCLQSDQPHWLRALAVRIDSLLPSGNSCTLDASDFITGLEPGKRVYKWKAPRSISARSATESNFVEALRPILVAWFDFPSSVHEWTRRVFLRLIKDRFGSKALYLPVIWEVYEQMASKVDPKGRHPTKSAAEKWLTSVTTELNNSEYDSVTVESEELFAVLAKAGYTPFNLDSAQPQTPPTRRALNVYVEIPRARLPQQPSVASTSGLSSEKPLQHASKGEKANYGYVNHVFKNSDKQLPFRDLAASRRAVLGPGGPYLAENLHTRKGFFSAMVYRAITHHSAFLTVHGESMFASNANFQSRMKRYKKQKDKFFCDPSAYGMWTDLSVKKSETFWRTSNRQEDNQWLLGGDEDRTTFSKLWHKFVKSPNFPNIGPLIGYLLAADYAIAGVVDMPSLRKWVPQSTRLTREA